jgi:hypothetical protein
MRHRPIFLSMLFTAVGLLSAPAWAHNASITLIQIRAGKGQLEVRLDLNQPDLLEHALKRTPPPARFADRTDFEDAAPKLLAYVVANLSIRADGRELPAPAAVDWPPQHAELTHIDATGLEVPSVIAMTLRYTLPAEARKIELISRLYSAPGFQATFDLSFYSENSRKPIVAVVARDERFTFELRGEAARVREELKISRDRPRPVLSASVLMMAGSLAVLLIIMTIIIQRRRRSEH